MAIAFDLDGTLAEYHGWQGVEHIGKPIEPMVQLLLQHMRNGEKCYIFTARVSDEGDAGIARHYIREWLRKNDLPFVEVTAIKRKDFDIMYDDRAIRVKKNQGILVNE